ncbi:MAG: HNH endonuclease [Chloroflexota bacterium]
MVAPRSIISFRDIIAEEGAILQRGMNYRMRPNYSIILMSLRRDAPYADRVEEGGKVLVYEGHDVPRTAGSPDPKTVDQPLTTAFGRPTQNGLFMEAAVEYKEGKRPPENVRVYEKLKSGIWVYNGVFKLLDGWQEMIRGRRVCKFRLELTDILEDTAISAGQSSRSNDRVIPSAVKQEVFKRDGGRCRQCGSSKNLHFDHDIPYSLGGSSVTAENVQLLCAECNLKKRDKIR